MLSEGFVGMGGFDIFLGRVVEGGRKYNSNAGDSIKIASRAGEEEYKVTARRMTPTLSRESVMNAEIVYGVK